MAKKKVNAAALLALKKWREEHTDKDGHLVGVKRKTKNEILDEKKLKLNNLESQVAELKAQIAKIDASVNKKRKENATKGYTAEEVEKALAAMYGKA